MLKNGVTATTVYELSAPFTSCCCDVPTYSMKQGGRSGIACFEGLPISYWYCRGHLIKSFAPTLFNGIVSRRYYPTGEYFDDVLNSPSMDLCAAEELITLKKKLRTIGCYPQTLGLSTCCKEGPGSRFSMAGIIFNGA